MSIVGTRPPLISETNLYEPRHKARLAIKPGITGMWQVSGRSDITDFEEVVRLDKDYYVTMILRELSERQNFIVFKGGTSLSKCHKAIKRFSEDIDITIDRRKPSMLLANNFPQPFPDAHRKGLCFIYKYTFIFDLKTALSIFMP